MRGSVKYVERTREWPSDFYDLEADPGETRNAIGDAGQQAQIRELARELADFFKRSGAPPLEEWHSTTKQHMTVYKR